MISNGIALCTLHHAAFDSFMIGVTPDYVIRVRPDVLEEEDEPVLMYARRAGDSAAGAGELAECGFVGVAV